MKILDIIIPQYKENEEVIKTLLDSINNQNVDYSLITVTIVNDYSDVILNDDFLKSYKNLNINYLRNEKNTGPGLARQLGIDNTNSPYIMFCDADDSLCSNVVLSKIIDALIKIKPKYLVTNIIVEKTIDGKKTFEKRRKEKTFPWMHGKVYSREMLDNYGIRFSPYVRHLEDTYFTNCIILTLDPKNISYYDFDTYLWKENVKSLTRIENEIPYLVRIFDDYFNTSIYLYDFLKEHKSKMKFNHLVMSSFGIYIALNSDLFEPYKDKKAYYLNKQQDYLSNKANIFKLYKMDILNDLFNHELEELKLRNGIKYCNKTLNDFIKEYINEPIIQ